MSPEKESRKVLEPTERFSEILFGLIMVLTFTGALSAAESGRGEVRTMLIGAIGCNLAWGLIDAVFYLMNTLGQRGHGALILRRLRERAGPTESHGLIAEALPAPVASILRPEEYESIRQRLVALPESNVTASLGRDDFRGALETFLLVFLTTFPVVIPFFLMRDAMTALRVSNAVAIFLLFLGGYRFGRYVGYRPWLTALGMVAIGVALVAITIALGG